MTAELVIEGIGGTWTDMGARVGSEFMSTPPQVQERLVEIAGRADGPLDLTESLTGTRDYGRRVFSVPLVVRGASIQARDAAANEVAASLDGIRARFRLSWEDSRQYTGRFMVDSITALSMAKSMVQVTIYADPFATVAHAANEVDGWGGAWHVLTCGDCPQHPTITCRRQTYVESEDGYGVTLEPGTWRIPYITLTKGENLLYVRTTKPKTRTWADLASSTWASKAGDSWDYVHVDGVSHTPDPLDSVVIEYEIKEI